MTTVKNANFEITISDERNIVEVSKESPNVVTVEASDQSPNIVQVITTTTLSSSIIILSEQASAPSAPGTGTAALFLGTVGTPRFKSIDDAGVVSIVGPLPSSTSVAAVSSAYATDTYLAGSSIVIQAGTWKAKTVYRCTFDMVKSAAGTAAFTTNIRMGTLGTTGDASILSLAFAVGTAVADTGRFEVVATFRTVGSGTSAVLQGWIACSHALAATGLITTGASGFGMILGTSAGFNSTTQTTIGISVNGGASFSGTNTQVLAQLIGG